MAEKRILLEFQVEAHGCLSEGVGTLTSHHPRGEFELNIRNLAVDPGTDRPLLSIQLIMPGDDLPAAEKPGTEALRRYLHYLTLVTNLTFRIHKLVRIVDWTRGLRARDCIQFERFPGDALPFAAIGEEHLRSVEVLQEATADPRLQRALRWFSAGISARFPDDQFQFFWLAVELIAQSLKGTDKVHDRCPQCQSPLYCTSCKTHPTHRPYPKQAIEQLFSKLIPLDGAEFFALTNDVRNAIMHGEPVDNMVAKRDTKLSDLVDELGRVAWAAILDALGRSFPEAPSAKKLAFLQTNIYHHRDLRIAANLVVFSRNPDEPTLDELARPEIGVVYGKAKEDE
jgi:hypothetical protein